MPALSFWRRRRAALALAGSSFALTMPAADLPRSEPVPAAAAPAPSRGALLYDTHCIECHSVQVHWRDRRQARDWPTLQAEVLRWQAAARLGWTAADVEAVTDYLNHTIYGFAAPQAQARESLPAASR